MYTGSILGKINKKNIADKQASMSFINNNIDTVMEF